MKSSFLRLGKDAVLDFLEDKAMRLSAAIAYYSAFSLAPLLVVAISVAAIVFGHDAVSGHIQKELTSYVGPQAAEAVQSMIRGATNRGGGLLSAAVGMATVLAGATGIFGQLKDALNTIWEVRRKKGGNALKSLLADRILSFGMVLVISFLLLVSLMLSTALTATSAYFERLLHLPPAVWTIVAFVASFSMVTLLFALMFKFLPDAKVAWNHVWSGAVMTALLFEAGKFGLSWYLGRESTASTFGAAASVVLVLMWIYYASCILLLGAEFTQVLARSKGHPVTPKPGAEALPTEDRIQQGLARDRRQPTSLEALHQGRRSPKREHHQDLSKSLESQRPPSLPKLALSLAIGFVITRARGRKDGR